MWRLTDNPWYKKMSDSLKKRYWPKLVKIFTPRQEIAKEELLEARRRSQIKIKDLLAVFGS